MLFTIPLLFPSTVRADNGLPTRLPDCQFALQTQPKEIIFACADAGIQGENMQWIQWGKNYTYASGQIVENDCAPDCAGGHFHTYTASFTAYGSQRCPGGQLAYRHVAYVITNPAWPNPEQRTGDKLFPFKPGAYSGGTPPPF